MATKRKKAAWAVLAVVAVLVILGVFFFRRSTESPSGDAETRLGIEGYSSLSRYVIADDPDFIRDTLTGLLGEMVPTSKQQDRTAFSIAGAQGTYEGWYTADVFSVYRIPSELPLPDDGQLRQQALDTMGQLGWADATLVSERTAAGLYSAVFQPQLGGVPLDGFQIALWLDAEGLQRIDAAGYIHVVEEDSVYDLASMYSRDAILLQFDDVFSEDARQRGRRLPWLETPVLTYVRTEEKPDELILAWKLAFEESYTDSNGEMTRQSGYYLVDAENPAVIARVEAAASGGLIPLRDWETIVRCILGPEYTVEVRESEDTPDLAVTITGPGGDYSGTASTDEYLKFSRDSAGADVPTPTDEEAQALAEELAEALGTVLSDKPLIYRHEAGAELYFYLGSSQNNSVYLLYDAQGLQSAELVTGMVLRPAEPAADVAPDPAELENVVGSYTVAAAEIDADILTALQNGGLTIRCDAELPEAPERVASYTTESVPLDCDALIRTVFGQDCDYVLEADAAGYHCTLQTAAGSYAVVYNVYNARRFGVLRTSPSGAEASSEEENIAALAERIMALPGLDAFHGTYEKSYETFDGTTRLLYQERLEGIPVSSHPYYLTGMEGPTHGTTFSLNYDSYGLTSIEIERPIQAIPTGTEITGMISASDALEIVKSQMEGASVNAVQVIRSVQLVYVNPVEDGGALSPTWELSYDFYTFGRTTDEVDIDTGEYVYLVDAVSGQCYAKH